MAGTDGQHQCSQIKSLFSREDIWAPMGTPGQVATAAGTQGCPKLLSPRVGPGGLGASWLCCWWPLGTACALGTP